jgi:hypothetical protein
VAVKSYIDAWANGQNVIMKRAEQNMGSAIKNRARMLAPKLTGALRADGRVENKGDRTVVVFGSEKVPYARRRHFENRKNPQTLHYLKRAGDSVVKENIKKYIGLSV